ncbi:MAG TPA: TerC/Alx family metal homeostasis membrane protein [Kofleriaceae bacterium]|nr:TerC/Alx family metal homeostasis membrane protein [Kofleriaceae bacterium]
MIWFWLGFFGLVAFLLFLDLGVLHRKDQEQSLKSAAMWTVGWVILGLSFSAVVYLIYENHWLGAHLKHARPHVHDGGEAAVTYVSAYLLEQALSVDNIFVIALTFAQFKVPQKFQHRVLFWGILGAVIFRVAMLGGGVWLAQKFDWIFYIFGGFLAFKGAELLKEFVDKMRSKDEEDEEEGRLPWLVRKLQRIVRIEGDHQGHFLVNINGRRVLTILALCLITVELQDIVFALDSIPAVLSVSNETFIIVTSNIFAILGLRSLYFVLAGMMAKFEYLELALGVLLIGIGVKMVLHNHVHITHVQSLVGIAVILSAGVIASVFRMRGSEPPPSEPGPA